MFRQVFSPRCLKTIHATLKCFVPKLIKVRYLTQLSFGVVYAQHINLRTPENLEHEEDLRRATLEGENYLSQLICMLRTLILETSIEYQECLIKQIELTKENTKIGPVGKHWDQLTYIRIKANELKDELHKYQALAKNIGDIAENQHSTVFDGKEVVLDKLNGELLKLRKLCDVQLKEIHKYEKQLLEVNRESILHDLPK